MDQKTSQMLSVKDPEYLQKVNYLSFKTFQFVRYFLFFIFTIFLTALVGEE